VFFFFVFFLAGLYWTAELRHRYYKL